jgi:hypothetical protein
MRAGIIRTLVVFLLAAGVSSPSFAQLTSTETKDASLVYVEPLQSFIVPHLGRSFVNSLEFHRKLFDFTPSERMTVLLTDFSDVGNAGADAVPRDFVTVRIAPLSFAYETFTASERMAYLMNHELVHVVTTDRAAGRDRVFRNLFRGKVAPVAQHPESIGYFYLTAPRRSAPRWYLEGIAVFLDTWMAGGIGRAQGAYDEMVFRSMVRDESRFYDPLGLASELTKVDFQQESNSYLYGTRFMSYLAHEYGPESLIRWTSRTDGSKAYYASRFRQVYGVPLEQAWGDWVRFERQFQAGNLAAIRKYPTTPFTDISKQALGSLSRAHVDRERGKIYAGLNYPGTTGYIGAIDIDTGAIEAIHDIKQPRIYTVTSLAYDPAERTLFYTADNAAYRDLMAVDIDSKEQRRLIKDGRIGDLAFSAAERTLWGIRTFNGICTLVRIPYPYTEWRSVYSWPYGETVYDLDVSADGALLSAAVGEINGRQGVRVMRTASLLTGDAAPLARFDFGSAIPSNFTFSPDGRFLYGSSYYTGVSNIFRYDLQTAKVDALTNAETGFFRPIPLDDTSLLVFRFTGEGFVPAVIPAARPLNDISPITFLGQQLIDKHPILKSWGAGSPGDVPIESLITGKRKYNPLTRMGLESLYPVVEGYKETFGIGMHVRFSDSIGLNGLAMTAVFTPSSAVPASERTHLRAEYRRFEWNALAALNNADFYDLFGPTKTSRRGYELRLGRTWSLIFDEPRRMTLKVEGGFAGNLDQLPEYQNVPVNVDRLATLTADLSFTDTSNSLGGVDDEKGRKWRLFFQEDGVRSASFTRVHGVYDAGFALPLDHSSVWVRSAAGFSPQDRDEPFANFFFGGFGNNYIDHGDEKRYREYSSLPGAELNEIGGRNFIKSTVEWNLPPLHFSRAGTPGFYLTWMRPAVFATGLMTNLDASEARREATSVGGQLDFRFNVLSTLELTASVGTAVTFEAGHAPRREAMASLKILR